MNEYPGIVFDLEADGLEPTKIYVLAATNSGSDEPHATTDYDSMRRLKDQDILVCHNCIRFDKPVMERILGIEFSPDTLFVDTLALSWYLSPDRPKHGLESYGVEYGVPKPEIDNWENLPIEDYIHRCKEDVRINERLWKDQWRYLLKLYGSEDAVFQFLRYIQFKMTCARLQEESGWKLDILKCKTSIEKLEKLQSEKINELERVLPKVPIKGFVKPPSKPVKANGELSEAGKRWHELLASRGLPPEHGEPVEIIRGYEPPNAGSHQQIKDWLFSLGWEPDVFKTNDKGVEVPQINKLKQDGGGVSESIKRLAEHFPDVSLVDGLGVLGHRLGILRGFIRDVDSNGFLRARVAGLTNTLRFKHSELVNLPKIDAPFGQDIRGCLSAPDGYELCGSDMSSLEDRTKQHFMWKYDPEYVKEMMTPDFDPHLDIAVIAKLMTKEESDAYKRHDTSFDLGRLKTIRGIAKNTNYAGVYGAGAAKIAKTAGINISEARGIHESYWERNWSVKAVAQAVKTKTISGQMWLFNPVSKFWYSLRAEKDKFSTLNQGTGVFCFDTWLGFILQQRRQLTGQFHDEGIWTVKKGHREEMTAIIKNAIHKTNEVLSLNRELDCEVQFGDVYADIH